jgi:hypothetical protein
VDNDREGGLAKVQGAVLNPKGRFSGAVSYVPCRSNRSITTHAEPFPLGATLLWPRDGTNNVTGHLSFTRAITPLAVTRNRKRRSVFPSLATDRPDEMKKPAGVD